MMAWRSQFTMTISRRQACIRASSLLTVTVWPSIREIPYMYTVSSSSLFPFHQSHSHVDYHPLLNSETLTFLCKNRFRLCEPGLERALVRNGMACSGVKPSKPLVKLPLKRHSPDRARINDRFRVPWHILLISVPAATALQFCSP